MLNNREIKVLDNLNAIKHKFIDVCKSFL